MKLVSLLPFNIKKEADEKEKPADDAEGGASDNPFASAGGDEGGAEGGEEGGDEKDAADAGGEEDAKDDAKTSDDAKPLDVVFNPSRVKKYNDTKFRDNRGTVVAISRFGLTVKLPDEKTIFVNFEDIL